LDYPKLTKKGQITIPSHIRERAKYQEKDPWEDCIVAATATQNRAKFVVTEDPHFVHIKEIETRRTSELQPLRVI